MSYHIGMWMRVVSFGSVLALLAGSSVNADETDSAPTASHRYAKIAPRNVFGVKPPPPPPEPAPVVEPPKEKPDFFLSGFTSIGGEKRAFVTYQPKGKPMEYPEPLLMDVEVDGIKLLEVNEAEETVRIAYNGEEITLNFDDNGAKAVAAPATPTGVPGMLPGISPNGPRGSVPPPPVPSLGAPFNGTPNFGSTGNTGPTVVGRGGQVLSGLGNNFSAQGQANNPGLPAINVNGSNPGGTVIPAIQPAPGQFGQTVPSNPGRTPRQAPPAPFPSFGQ